MQETIKAIISLLDPCDQVPDEYGEYIISSTIHALGSCSLSRGGSYVEKANYEALNSELSDCTGIFRRNEYPGVYFLTFNPDKLNPYSANKLLSLLEDISLNKSSHCINEDLAYQLEFSDTIEYLLEMLAGTEVVKNDEVLSKVADDEIAKAGYSMIQSLDPSVMTVEPGPGIFINEEKFMTKILPEVKKHFSDCLRQKN